MNDSSGSEDEVYVNYYNGKNLSEIFGDPQTKPVKHSKNESEHILRSQSKIDNRAIFKKSMRQLYDEVFGQKKEIILRSNIENLVRPDALFTRSNTIVVPGELSLFLICFQLPLKIIYNPAETSVEKVDQYHIRNSL